MRAAHWLLITALSPAMAAGSGLAVPQLKAWQPALGTPEEGPVLGPATLPLVDFRLGLEFVCPGESRPAGLFVSIADTAVRAESASSPVEVRLRVPAAQLEGVKAAAACGTDAPTIIPKQVSAFATLRCTLADGTARSTTVSQPLDLWLDCAGLQGRTDRPGADSLRDD
jgi:hypothetical protein